MKWNKLKNNNELSKIKNKIYINNLLLLKKINN